MRLPTEAEVSAARATSRTWRGARHSGVWMLTCRAPSIFLKLENLQPLGSFKIRAAVNAMKSRDPGALKDGVVGASAGNFGLGLALVAQQMGIPATIVAPDSAAEAKTDALKALGATVVRVPFADWWQVLMTRRFDGTAGAFFHPVAEQAVVAGNATIGAEIVEDLDAIDTVIVPFGGGGLVSGIGSVMRRMKPQARMLVVEAETAQPAAAALEAGHPVKVTHTPSFVDGIGSGMVLEEMWPLIRENVDGALCVSLKEITAAIRLLAMKHRVIAEGAGAASVAAALSGRAGQGNIVCIVSGGNIDASKLAAILSGNDPI